MFPRLTGNIRIALAAIGQNMVRGILTSLGIIFGVASVIAMLAIGTGAKNKILEQLSFLGANNIIIMKMEKQEEGEVTEEEDEKEVKRFTPGLTLSDVETIRQMVPGVKRVVPEIVVEKVAIREGYKRSVKLVGVTNEYFQMSSFKIMEGNSFTESQLDQAASVCIIGSAVKSRFFATESAIGKRIKVGANWLTVVGVAAPRSLGDTKLKGIGIRDYDMDVYAPVKTALLRYTDRARVSARQMKAAGGGGMMMMMGDEESNNNKKQDDNYHQVDRITVTVDKTERVSATAEILLRMLTRRHNQVVDFEVHVPEQMLEQEQSTQNTFNWTLGAIAAISLLVGGIGIMNIMLASVMERIKEIGLRLSLGATQADILTQFMSEAVSLSVGGGLIGIMVGVGLSYLIEWWSDIPTIITPFSILLSFFVSVAVGVAFGYFPARKAAKQDPVISLRHE
jgi:putative ABC transport system permease protein